MSDQLPETSTAHTLDTIQRHVGGCREWVSEKNDCCWAPAEYVLWGKLIRPEGLGPRCFHHAVQHVGHHALYSRANYALIHLNDLARDIENEQ